VSLLTVQQITNEALRVLTTQLSKNYPDTDKTTYTMRFSYGKYNVYKNEYDLNLDRINTTRLAHRVSKETAQGMLKLLKGASDE
jgi:hypothetical protein